MTEQNYDTLTMLCHCPCAAFVMSFSSICRSVWAIRVIGIALTMLHLQVERDIKVVVFNEPSLELGCAQP